MAATALASERRAPSIAAVESAYAVFQIKRDVSKANLTWYERAVFWYIWIPFMRFCTNRLHLPLWEIPDWVKCPNCKAKVAIEGGGCWTEKEGIVTAREMAQAACKSSDWYFHRLPVNGVMTGETSRTRVDHDFPLAATKQYRRASADAYEGSLNELEKINQGLATVTAHAARLNTADR